MIELREPLSALAVHPTTHTKGWNAKSGPAIRIYDTTARDGEQMAGVSFTPHDKLAIVTTLAEMGVDAMEVALPATSPSEREACRLILSARRSRRMPAVEISVVCRPTQRDIDQALDVAREAGCAPRDLTVVLLSALSDLHLKYVIGRSLLQRGGYDVNAWLSTPIEVYRALNISVLTAAIRYARAAGIERIEFVGQDASRCDVTYATEWAAECVRAGGTRACFSDTCGVLTPEAIDHYVPTILRSLRRESPGTELTIHCHDDLGLASINTVRALLCGATHASVTANGIGERAGNASLHQVVMILRELYGVTLPRFDYARLCELRLLVERISGIALQAHEPIIGAGAFAHESGIHTAGLLVHPSVYQFLDARDVGGERCFVFGKHSGAAGVAAVLEEHVATLRSYGIAVTDDLVEDTVQSLKEQRATSADHAGEIARHYSYYSSLGRSEAELVRWVISRHARAGGETTGEMGAASGVRHASDGANSADQLVASLPAT